MYLSLRTRVSRRFGFHSGLFRLLTSTRPEVAVSADRAYSAGNHHTANGLNLLHFRVPKNQTEITCGQSRY